MRVIRHENFDCMDSQVVEVPKQNLQCVTCDARMLVQSAGIFGGL